MAYCMYKQSFGDLHFTKCYSLLLTQNFALLTVTIFSRKDFYKML